MIAFVCAALTPSLAGANDAGPPVSPSRGPAPGEVDLGLNVRQVAVSSRAKGTRPFHLVDGRPKTVWRPKAPGGVGEWLELEFGPEQVFTGVEITKRGGALRELELSFDDGQSGSRIPLSFPGEGGEVLRATVPPTTASTVRLTVKALDPAAKRPDVNVAEVKLFGARRAQRAKRRDYLGECVGEDCDALAFPRGRGPVKVTGYLYRHVGVGEWPNITDYEDGFAGFHQGCGNPCTVDTFVDMQTGEVSKTYDDLLAVDGKLRRVAVLTSGDTPVLQIVDIFSGVVLKEFDRPFKNKYETGAEASFASDGTLRLRYVNQRGRVIKERVPLGD